MSDQEKQSESLDRLREQAEERLKQHSADGQSVPAEPTELSHELEVHQTELRIQNEELKRAQQELSALHREYEYLYEFAPCGYLTLNAQGIITRANRMAVNLLGYPQSDLKRMSFSRFIVHGWEGLFFTARQKAEKTGEKQSVELLLQQDQDARLWVLLDIDADRPPNKEQTQWRLVLVDIQERKQAEEILVRQQKSIAMNKRIAEVFLTSSDDSLFADVLDVLRAELDCRYGYFGYIDEAGDLICPSMTREVWDQCRVSGKDITFPRSDWGGLWGRSLLEKVTRSANSGLQLPQGHLSLPNALFVPILHQGALIGQFGLADKPEGFEESDRELLESAANQTAPILQAHLEKSRREQEREHLEQQFRQAQKMEAIGTLAGGIAHDFNNILASIIGFTELVLDEVPEDSLMRENLFEVLTAGNRAKDLVKQILNISRHENQAKQPVEINLLIKEALKMLRSTLPASIDIQSNICEQPLIARADPTQIHQVVMNLATNALQAMSGQEGRLEVGLGPLSLETGNEDLLPELGPGSYACLSVRDTGRGIPEDRLDAIFEPYFTTKEKGTGTGLGLAVVHGIVKSHHGGIRVSSEPGKGSTFWVYLPLSREEQPEIAKQESEALPVDGEHVLVVDDEPPIVKLLEKSLHRLGYDVTAKTDSQKALQTFRESPDTVDLVLTDMSMPGMNGDQLAAAIKDLRPDVPILVCTGYNHTITAENRNSNIDGFLSKPVKTAELAKKIRSLLDRTRGKGREHRAESIG